LGYFYIVGTVLCTVYGQIILKWRIGNYGALPDPFLEKVIFLIRLLSDGYILSGFIAAFVASLFWMAAMTRFDLSHAYPFISLNFVFVIILSGVFFHEAITTPKIIGLGLIVLGIVVGSRG
jgi:multidrug transporter EmrE-like cation transporter